jgi:hypothetical protein
MSTCDPGSAARPSPGSSVWLVGSPTPTDSVGVLKVGLGARGVD